MFNQDSELPSSRPAPPHRFEPLSSKVIAACIDVQRQLGIHCKEEDYQRALEIALPKFAVQFEREVEIPIEYDGVVVTRRRVDFACWDQNDRLFLETKAEPVIQHKDVEQSLRYLIAGKQAVLLLVNFGVRPLRPRRFVNTHPSEHNP